jgi:transcriptional regulator with XRE-family HTH domain
MVTSRDDDPLFLEEWMDAKELDDAAVARRMKTSRETITRYRNGDRRPNDRKIAQLARALGIQPGQLFQHPNRVSLDAMLVGAPDDLIKEAAAHTEILLRRLK